MWIIFFRVFDFIRFYSWWVVIGGEKNCFFKEAGYLKVVVFEYSVLSYNSSGSFRFFSFFDGLGVVLIDFGLYRIEVEFY